ncbi:MAG: hypothetical protein ACLQVJ_02025 [Syntrophobacteraceae bacterium]
MKQSTTIAGASPFTVWLAAAVAFAIAAFPRVLAAGGSLWFDEIWSLQMLKRATHFWDVFTIHHDNNHILMSLYLYMLGAREWALTYRLFSIFSGAASVVLMGIINFRHGLRAAIITMMLGAFSYPLILYSSEARGFAPAVLCALLTYYFLERSFEKDSLGTIALFWVSSVMGILAQLLFVYVYLSLTIWSIVRLLRSKRGIRTVLISFARYHLVPLIFIALLYWFHVRRLIHGGSDPLGAELLGETLSLLSGAPPLLGEPGRVIGISVSLLGLFAGLFYLYRDKSDEWIFFACQLIVAPALFVIAAAMVSESHLMQPRHFLLYFPFYYIMAGRTISRIFDGGRLSRTLVIALMLFFLSGNIERTVAQIEIGRGDYKGAVQYMAEETQGPYILVGSDHDYRNKMLLLFFSKDLPAGKRLIYFEQDSWPAAGPEWFVVHSQQSDFRPIKRIYFRNGSTYRLARHFPYYGLSGWHWAIYRRN